MKLFSFPGLSSHSPNPLVIQLLLYVWKPFEQTSFYNNSPWLALPWNWVWKIWLHLPASLEVLFTYPHPSAIAKPPLPPPAALRRDRTGHSVPTIPSPSVASTELYLLSISKFNAWYLEQARLISRWALKTGPESRGRSWHRLSELCEQEPEPWHNLPKRVGSCWINPAVEFSYVGGWWATCLPCLGCLWMRYSS